MVLLLIHASPAAEPDLESAELLPDNFHWRMPDSASSYAGSDPVEARIGAVGARGMLDFRRAVKYERAPT